MKRMGRILLTILIVGHAPFAASLEQAQSQYEGVWQFEDRAVFLHIGDKGRTFQCILFPDSGPTYAHGKMEGNTVKWGSVYRKNMLGVFVAFPKSKISWGPDRVSIVKGGLAKERKGKVHIFHRVDRLPKECYARL
jgi:hypothetical protein